MGYGKGLGKVLKHIRDKYTHELPTGPHTDVRRRGVNPSVKKILKKVRPVTLVPTVPKMPKALGDKLKKLGKK